MACKEVIKKICEKSHSWKKLTPECQTFDYKKYASVFSIVKMEIMYLPQKPKRSTTRPKSANPASQTPDYRPARMSPVFGNQALNPTSDFNDDVNVDVTSDIKND